MKIGEALNQRKYLMNHIPQLQKKLEACITVVKDAPVNKAESTAEELRAALDKELVELRNLIISINLTNNSAKLPCGLTVMEAIAHRESLKQSQAVWTSIVGHIRPRTEKDYRDSERITYVVAPDIHPAGIKQSANGAAKSWRELDNQLQQANWTIDLVEYK